MTNDQSVREPHSSSSLSPAPSRSLFYFFVLSYALGWIVFIAIAAIAGEVRSSVLGLLALPGAFAPGLAAVSLTAVTDGRAGLRELLSPVLQWRVGARWYLFALLYLPAVKLSVALIHRLLVGAWPHFGSEAWYVMLAGILISTPFQAGEEVGWRGYALPRLTTRFGVGVASLILGLLWAFWHLPLFFVRGADKYGQSLTVYVLQVTAVSVVFAWLYFHTRKSLLLPMLLHAAINNTKDMVPSATPGAMNTFGLHASLPAWLTVGVLWMCAGYFLFHWRSKRLLVRESSDLQNDQALPQTTISSAHSRDKRI